MSEIRKYSKDTVRRAKEVLKSVKRDWGGSAWARLGSRFRHGEVCREIVHYILLSQADESQPLEHTADVARCALQMLEEEEP